MARARLALATALVESDDPAPAEQILVADLGCDDLPLLPACSPPRP